MAAKPATALALLLRADASDDERDEVTSLTQRLHLNTCVTNGDGWSAISIGDGTRPIDAYPFEQLGAVGRAVALSAPYRLASRELFGTPRSVGIGGSKDGEDAVVVGGAAPLMAMIAPAPVPAGTARRAERLVATVRSAGGAILHAGEYSPGDDLGGERAVDADRLAELKGVADAAGQSLCVEVSDVRHVAGACDFADVLQVGHRNMQNFSLLREVGGTDRPVLLKRGVGATIEEFLLAAEYVLAGGNGRVLLCESGVRVSGSTHEPRFEINAIPLLKKLTHLPVLAHPMHAASQSYLVPAVARAAIAAGADGLILEVDEGVGEGSAERPMDVVACRRLLEELRPIATVIGRTVAIAEPQPGDATVESGDDDRVRSLHASSSRPLEPMDVLRRTEGTLASVIESLLGEAPRLDVLRQTVIKPPYPSWLTWLLRPEGDLLVRWTGYMSGDVALSRNLAYVDFGRVDPTILARLENEELNLGELFSSQEIDKFGFEFGTGGDAEELDVALREGHLNLRHPYVWRRYIAATAGRVGFLVMESLPSVTWRQLLGARAQPVSARGDV
ncbi:MAG: hypothetical protein ABR529_08160 [Actinomycetota bacterium]